MWCFLFVMAACKMIHSVHYYFTATFLTLYHLTDDWRTNTIKLRLAYTFSRTNLVFANRLPNNHGKVQVTGPCLSESFCLVSHQRPSKRTAVRLHKLAQTRYTVQALSGSTVSLALPTDNLADSITAPESGNIAVHPPTIFTYQPQSDTGEPLRYSCCQCWCMWTYPRSCECRHYHEDCRYCEILPFGYWP